MKKSIKRNDNQINEKNSFFNLFFTKFTYWGLISILISIIIDQTLQNVPSLIFLNFNFSLVLHIISSFLNTVGIALFIGAIFDMAKNSEAFVDMISKILSNIVVSKTFLNTLSQEDKRQSLEIILKPSGDQLQQYSNINSYFQKKVDETTAMFDTNFKSNLNINVDVYKNTEKKCIESKSILSYRIYKINNEFRPIETWLEMSDSEFVSTKLYYENKVKTITKDEMKPIKNADDSTSIYSSKSYFEVPEDLHKYPYLTVQYEIIERGFDHWTNYHWSSLTPYDGINFSLRCSDDLTIKDHFIFDKFTNYSVNLNEKKTQIEIISTIWLNQYSGLSITIADTKGSSKKKNDAFDSAIEDITDNTENY